MLCHKHTECEWIVSNAHISFSNTYTFFPCLCDLNIKSCILLTYLSFLVLLYFFMHFMRFVLATSTFSTRASYLITFSYLLQLLFHFVLNCVHYFGCTAETDFWLVSYLTQSWVRWWFPGTVVFVLDDLLFYPFYHQSCFFLRHELIFFP